MDTRVRALPVYAYEAYSASPPGFFAACCGGLAGHSKAQICALELRPPGCCGGRRFLRRTAKPPHRIPVGAVILTYLVLSIEPMVRCMLRRISDAGIFYCSENSLQCYNESAEPTAERIVRIRSMQPGARESLTRATHRAQHPVLRAGAGVSSPSTLFYPPTIPLQQYLLKATINRGHSTRLVFVCVLSLRETRVDECTVMLVLFMTH